MTVFLCPVVNMRQLTVKSHERERGGKVTLHFKWLIKSKLNRLMIIQWEKQNIIIIINNNDNLLKWWPLLFSWRFFESSRSEVVDHWWLRVANYVLFQRLCHFSPVLFDCLCSPRPFIWSSPWFVSKSSDNFLTQSPSNSQLNLQGTQPLVQMTWSTLSAYIQIKHFQIWFSKLLLNINIPV